MSEFTQEQRTIVERVIQAWAYGDAQWIAIRKDAVRALLAAYDALRAQPSAEPHSAKAHWADHVEAVGAPAPPREAGQQRKVCTTTEEYWAAMTEWLRAQPIAAKGVFRDD